MSGDVLVAGIGNIFQGDDAFGVAVAQRLGCISVPANVRVIDAGIRSLDLAFALMDEHALTILVDATSRGGEPGTIYTIEVEPSDIPDVSEEGSVVNSHALDPVRVLSLAKSMGARFGKTFVVGCEPLVVDCDATGKIGLSDPVQAAVVPALETVLSLIEEFANRSSKDQEEVYSK
ncbi:MAG TPA: hydrogenase maturation protease [Bryobacteraceae bacterium]|jgi:hydrogenase maturation protease|nr:hydrogenase maturation protease [Bryobacteraceae bacterium]